MSDSLQLLLLNMSVHFLQPSGLTWPLFTSSLPVFGCCLRTGYSLQFMWQKY